MLGSLHATHSSQSLNGLVYMCGIQGARHNPFHLYSPHHHLWFSSIGKQETHSLTPEEGSEEGHFASLPLFSIELHRTLLHGEKERPLDLQSLTRSSS
ncbi:hypothetical protein BHE74_00050046 [Ensete ventricosum]|uniref:Uncharacterized protein n=1 Tax=Ensete ventricosum TaxID=4639 RepID=A0A444EBD7_ENSVE|nr:hypothetical protein B296_00028497 [Ensete ventricosum]RWW07682.1 hypothetical protein GW17_00028922 [Ensete ventricosum]RWW44208.1 hypothetical protein BHE74_00050046 [Ensete ventricosum]RZS08737.1 hypothetical protein BHM03_00039754 [Ensete ventricosum]